MKLMAGVLALAFASAAFAQIDSYTLRAKYGMPLNRETYDVPPGVRIVVDYGTGAQACRIEVSSTPGVDSATKLQLSAVINELIPPAVRGKELGRMMQAFGVISVSSTEYERVNISEPGNGKSRPAVTVVFKSEECRTQPVH